MIHESGPGGFDEATLVAAIGALPEAPLAMPKQRLERPAPTLRALRAWIERQTRAALRIGPGLGRSGG